MKRRSRRQVERFLPTKQILLISSAAVALLIAGTYFFVIFQPHHDDWPTADAKVIDARVTPVSLWSGRRGSHIKWVGEYRVQYSADGSGHDVWAETGFSDSSFDLVNVRLRPLPDHILIRYNPRRPEQAEVAR
jgi:hypothetical protein